MFLSFVKRFSPIETEITERDFQFCGEVWSVESLRQVFRRNKINKHGKYRE